MGNEPEENQNQNPEGGTGGSGAGAGTQAPEPPDLSGFVTKEEFQKVSQGVEQLVNMMSEGFVGDEPYGDPGVGFDPTQLPPDQLAYLYSQGALAPYMPMLRASVEDQGEKKFNQIVDELEKEPEVGKVDRKLARFAAEAILREVGDPITAVKEGVKYAAEVKKQFGQEGVEEYKKSLKRGPHEDDLGVGGAGTRAVEPAKTYDEVIARWSGETEV